MAPNIKSNYDNSYFCKYLQNFRVIKEFFRGNINSIELSKARNDHLILKRSLNIYYIDNNLTINGIFRSFRFK